MPHPLEIAPIHVDALVVLACLAGLHREDVFARADDEANQAAEKEHYTDGNDEISDRLCPFLSVLN